MKYNMAETRETLQSIVTILEDSSLQNMLAMNHATLAMFRPLAETNMDLGSIDATPHDVLERSISGLQIYRKFSFHFDEPMVDEFYGGTPKEGQLQRPAEFFKHLPNRWDEFVYIMTAGVTTGLILADPLGDAVGTWRQQVGHWDVENNRDMATLRGKFALRNFNNLLHGSDSPESAVREVGIIVSAMKRKLTVID